MCSEKSRSGFIYNLCVTVLSLETFSQKDAVVMKGKWIEVICVFKHSLTLYGDNTG